jgi:hypothetical protein
MRKTILEAFYAGEKERRLKTKNIGAAYECAPADFL